MTRARLPDWPEFQLAVLAPAWRRLASAVLLQGARDAGTVEGCDVVGWLDTEICVAWAELAGIPYSSYRRAVMVRSYAEGRQTARFPSGWIAVLPGARGPEALPARTTETPARTTETPAKRKRGRRARRKQGRSRLD